MIWLMVAVGGAAGAVARYGVSTTIARAAGLLLGAIASGWIALTIDERALIFAGVLGGFTTFSGVGIDTLALVQEGRGITAAVNVALQIAVGLGALALAYAFANR